MINKSKIVKDAQKFVTKGQLDKAIAEYSKITASTPNDTNTHNTIGDLYLKIGNKEKAVESYRAAADVLNKDGFALKAIALYKKVLNINPEQVDVQMQMGKLNAERGMLGNANENYMAAVSYFTKQGKRDKALEVYKILSNLNPKNITLAQKLAEMYMSEGLVAEGVSKLLELAEIKLAEGNLNEAKQFLDKASSKGSDRHDFIRISAKINLLEGRIPEAIEALEGLRDHDPGDELVLTLLGDAYIHAGRYEDATYAFEDLLEAQPSNTEYRKKLIDICVKSGDFETAWQHYRDQVDIHIDKKEYDKAQKLIQDYLKHSPDSIEARHVLADMYTSIGREDKIAELHAEMAELYVKGGEHEKAVNIYSKLLEQHPDNEDYKSAISRIKETPSSAPAPVMPDAPAVHEEPVVEHADEFPGLSAETGQTEEGLPGGFDEYTEEPAAEEPSAMDFISQFTDEETFEMPSGEPETGPEESRSVYDLSDMPDELPPLDLGGEGGEEVFGDEEQAPSGAYEISEETAAGIGNIDVFGDTESETDEGSAEEEWETPNTAAYDISGLESAFGEDAGKEHDAPAFQEVSSFEESLTEADVYIKYGLYPKAVELLSSLEFTHTTNPDIQLRFMDICKAQGDMDGFVERSIKLAGIYKNRDMEDEASAVIDKARSLSPDDERIKHYLGETVTHEEPAASPEESVLAASDDTSFAGFDDTSFGAAEEPSEEVQDESTLAGLSAETSLEEAFEPAENAPVEEPVSSPNSIALGEELAEADFYFKQGFYNEAKSIYRRLLASDPENDDLWDKYNAVVASEKKPAPAAPEPVEKTSLADLGEPESAQEAEEETSFADLGEPEPVSETVEETSFAGLGEAEPVQEIEEPAATGTDQEFDEAFMEMDTEPSETAIGQDEPETIEALEEPAADEEQEEGFFDLAAELRDEMGSDIITPVVSSSSFEDSNLDEVFQEFRKGVNEQIGSEDYETHYNLGIAYKEMGMIDEALSEFDEASKDPSRKLDCASMLGLCHLEKGEYKKAISYFKNGLEVKGHAREEYFGLKYDMATAYELSGDTASAFSAIADIYKEDQEFRDVKKRYQRLEKAAGASKAAEPDNTQTKDAKSKKSRVSYL